MSHFETLYIYIYTHSAFDCYIYFLLYWDSVCTMLEYFNIFLPELTMLEML